MLDLFKNHIIDFLMRQLICHVLGLLDGEDTVDDDPDDEILAELRKKQAELKAISQHNIMVTKKLYKLAKERMDQQEMKKKLAAADAEVGHSCLATSFGKIYK